MLSKSQISFVRSLHHKKYRSQHNLFIAEGIKICSELITSAYSIHDLFCTPAVVSMLEKLLTAAGKNIEITTVSFAELEKISSLSSPQDVIALVSALAQPAGPLTYPILVGDSIQDPGNLGTLIRIADWFAFPTMVLSPDCADWQNSKVVQASMGSIFRVKIKEQPLEAFFEANKHVVYGAVLGGMSIYETAFAGDGILVLGNESRGITSSLNRFIDHPVTIPRSGAAESLNVAIAGAIICAEIRRTNSPN